MSEVVRLRHELALAAAAKETAARNLRDAILATAQFGRNDVVEANVFGRGHTGRTWTVAKILSVTADTSVAAERTQLRYYVLPRLQSGKWGKRGSGCLPEHVRPLEGGTA